MMKGTNMYTAHKTKVQLSRDLLQSKLERELVAVVQSVVARMKS